jgi:hypothetical protein
MRFLVWKAFIGLLAYDVLGLGGNFERMYSCVRNWAVSPRVHRVDTVDRVCDAVRYACVLYPKHVRCLQISAVTTCLLRTCGVSAQMVIGAQILPFKGHAWTEVNGHPIHERRDVQRIYSVWERC